MQIPFLDLKVQYRQIEIELKPLIESIMAEGAFIGGPQVAAFEEEFAAFCGGGHCVGLNSGTDALRFALMAAGVGPGHEVVTVPHTFIATTEAISQAGAAPVFVDVDPETCCMDPARLREFVERSCRFDASTRRLVNQSTRRIVKGILPVHLYGQPVDMDPILAVADAYDLIVIEDACQAHGARYKGRPAGSMGRAGCFSFYPGKNLGAFGDAGAVVTRDERLAACLRMLREHGQSQKYYHDMEGYTGRLDAIQAAVLRLKLKRLADWNQARRRNAKLYDRLLAEVPGVTVVRESESAQSVYHLYVILVDDRDGLQQHLSRKGIGTGLHYPLPLHLQKAYAHMGFKKGDFPVSERLAERLLSLPMFAELSREQIEYVAGCVKEYVEGSGSKVQGTREKA
ncbi:MAG: DegT/DnrJ/EryC1/StrS family aminotransferase [Desulfobacterales bacterium]|jgi:dTDP-4-amino-4,6-dideoxygalactose transaminase|nr:DegT/DnrJ/EryC1/StrS family aminotransferase [Desulfobacterales bacterium]